MKFFKFLIVILKLIKLKSLEILILTWNFKSLTYDISIHWTVNHEHTTPVHYKYSLEKDFQQSVAMFFFPNPSTALPGRSSRPCWATWAPPSNNKTKAYFPEQWFISSGISLSNLTIWTQTFTCTIYTIGFLELTGYIPQDKPLAKPVSSEKAVKWFRKIINSHHGTQPFRLAI